MPRLEKLDLRCNNLSGRLPEFDESLLVWINTNKFFSMTLNAKPILGSASPLRTLGLAIAVIFSLSLVPMFFLASGRQELSPHHLQPQAQTEPGLQTAPQTTHAAVDTDTDELPPLKPDVRAPAVVDSTAHQAEPEPDADGAAKECPRWEAFDARMQAAKDFGANCRPLAALAGDFEVRLCESRRFCGQGYFAISRTDKAKCARAFDQTLSLSPELDAYFKNQLGPDSFHVLFDGPERASSSMWKHLGNCEYKLSFRLTNPGLFKVKLFHVHDSFLAVNEVMEGWHNPLFKPLLPDDTQLDVCQHHCSPFTAKKLELEINPSLPLCSRTEPQQGVYLRMTEETPREVARMKAFGHPYTWEPLGCRFDQRFEEHSNSSCHSKQSQFVGIFGDSHTRVLTMGLSDRLGGSLGGVPRNIKYFHIQSKFFNPQDLKAHPNASPVLGLDLEKAGRRDDDAIPQMYKGLKSTDIEYKYYEFINRFVDTTSYRGWNDEQKMDEAEMDILSGHFNTERYVDVLESVVSFLQWINSRRHLKNKKPIEFTWLGNVAFFMTPDKKSGHAVELDWRTNYRFKVWSGYAEKVFRRKGMKIMNSFDITLPWTQECPDHNHYHTTPAIEAMLDEALHKLNLCNV
ncbi:hypothetical protein BDR26DRAFT_915394 [Obelidium mucronatum]|nr:hypothetical protein BDR26DRAFT_915394 [Obelidium mucronatum]